MKQKELAHLQADLRKLSQPELTHKTTEELEEALVTAEGDEEKGIKAELLSRLA